MNATVTWKGRMSFAGKADSGFGVDLGTTSELGGDNDGFRPMELMALSLAGCTAMDVISILNKKRQVVSDFQVSVQAERTGEHPKVFTHAVILYRVTGQGVQQDALLRAIELSATRYCPAQAMLGRLMPIELRYEIYEATGENQTLTVQGSWSPA
jgi:putative redox protein